MKLMQNMSEAELEAVEVDKAKWLEAWKMYSGWGKQRLISWLKFHEDEAHREDIRRRLNTIRINRKGK